MQKDLLPENKQLTVKSHDAQMTDSGSMMCNAKGLGGTGKVVGRWDECSEREPLMHRKRVSVMITYIHTMPHAHDMVSWLQVPGQAGDKGMHRPRNL